MRLLVVFWTITVNICTPPSLGGEQTRTTLAALYSATKSLQNSGTAKLKLFSSILEAEQQLNSSCSGMQKCCAASEALSSSFAAQLPTFKSCKVAAMSCSNATIQLRSI